MEPPPPGLHQKDLITESNLQIESNELFLKSQRQVTPGRTLSFISLFFFVCFLKKAWKTTPKKQGFSISTESLKSLEKKGKTQKKKRNSSQGKNKQGLREKNKCRKDKELPNKDPNLGTLGPWDPARPFQESPGPFGPEIPEESPKESPGPSGLRSLKTVYCASPETLSRLFQTLFGPRGRKAPGPAPGDSFGDSSGISGSCKGRAGSQP